MISGLLSEAVGVQHVKFPPSPREAARKEWKVIRQNECFKDAGYETYVTFRAERVGLNPGQGLAGWVPAILVPAPLFVMSV